MFNTAFDGLGARAGDYYPPALREQIDELNGWIYDNVNNGVYKAGFATSQQAYDEAVDAVFTSLERLEQILGQHRYLTGNQLTEADIRLWTTLVRFDPVYVTHFKCDKRRISDYLNLYGFLRDIYQMPGIAETVSFRISVTTITAAIKPLTLPVLFPLGRSRIQRTARSRSALPLICRAPVMAPNNSENRYLPTIHSRLFLLRSLKKQVIDG